MLITYKDKIMKNIKLCTSTDGVACIEWTRPTTDFDCFNNVVLPIGMNNNRSNIYPKYIGTRNNKDYYSFNSIKDRSAFLRGFI